jgi:hypothetical protein
MILFHCIYDLTLDGQYAKKKKINLKLKRFFLRTKIFLLYL